MEMAISNTQINKIILKISGFIVPFSIGFKDMPQSRLSWQKI